MMLNFFSVLIPILCPAPFPLAPGSVHPDWPTLPTAALQKLLSNVIDGSAPPSVLRQLTRLMGLVQRKEAGRLAQALEDLCAAPLAPGLLVQMAACAGQQSLIYSCNILPCVCSSPVLLTCLHNAYIQPYLDKPAFKITCLDLTWHRLAFTCQLAHYTCPDLPKLDPYRPLLANIGYVPAFSCHY